MTCPLSTLHQFDGLHDVSYHGLQIRPDYLQVIAAFFDPIFRSQLSCY
jgi:hypothetical protein